jgi:hypothetical protein
MTIRKIIALGLLAGSVLIQFVRPPRTNPAVNPADTLHAHLRLTPDVANVLNRACRDCHSNETRWPWYSNVAPVSWWVIDHVNHGRSHFNYSEWSRYDRDESARLLKESCRMARNGMMPLRDYTRMHRDATLTPRDIDALCSAFSSTTVPN